MVKLSVYDALVGLRERWRRMRRRRSSLAELAACPPGELQRIARDVGVSVSDLRFAAAAHPGPSELLPRRLDSPRVPPYPRARTSTHDPLSLNPSSVNLRSPFASDRSTSSDSGVQVPRSHSMTIPAP